MKLAKQRCFYCPPEVWERIGRRARKAKLKVSRFIWLCCRQAAEGDTSARPEPAGHPLVLTEEEQRHLCESAHSLARTGRLRVRAPGGGEAVVRAAEAVRFLRLAEQGDEA